MCIYGKKFLSIFCNSTRKMLHEYSHTKHTHTHTHITNKQTKHAHKLTVKNIIRLKALEEQCCPSHHKYLIFGPFFAEFGCRHFDKVEILEEVRLKNNFFFKKKLLQFVGLNFFSLKKKKVVCTRKRDDDQENN